MKSALLSWTDMEWRLRLLDFGQGDEMHAIELGRDVGLDHCIGLDFQIAGKP